MYVIYQDRGHIDINNCYFYNNSADIGVGIGGAEGAMAPQPFVLSM